VKIQPQWVVTAGKQTNKQTNNNNNNNNNKAMKERKAENN
jgi:hypothetical protein